MQSSEEAISSRLKKRKIFLLLFVIRHYIAIFVTIIILVRKIACFPGRQHRNQLPVRKIACFPGRQHRNPLAVRKFACFSGWSLHKSVKNSFSEWKFAKSQENLVI